MSAAMADAEPEAEDGSEEGGGGRAPPGQSGSSARVAPLGPEQLRRVLEQVTKAQPPAGPPPPPFVLQDAARRLRDAAQQAALQRGPSAEPPRPPRLLPPQVRHREGRGETEAPRAPGPRGGRTGPESPRPPFGLGAAGGRAGVRPRLSPRLRLQLPQRPRPAGRAPAWDALPPSRRRSGPSSFVPRLLSTQLCSKHCPRCSRGRRTVSEGPEGGSGNDKAAALE